MRWLMLIVPFVATGAGAVLAGPSEVETAAAVDQLLNRHFEESGVAPAPLAQDEDFLRRVSLDLAGVVPSPSEVTRFGMNPAQSKRAELVDRFLATDDFGELWSHYWSDVIFLRATEQRFRLAQPAFEKWMEQQLNDNRSWKEITHDLLTATGSVQEDGQTGLIFAHTGNAEELASEIPRIFLGIQLSCANCHDHPTDHWKREQFHHLAAFLPQMTVRPENPGEVRTFAVKSYEGPRGRRRQFDSDQYFRLLDRNRDGRLTKSEARGPLATRFDYLVETFDRDKDGMLSASELADARLQADTQPGRGSAEYYMPDLKNPASKGTLMQPVFFLPEVHGERVRSTDSDQVLRHALAEMITSPDNPWFSRAFVNRIWSEMLGEGFYMPIDDLGPEREAVCPDVLDLLSEGFVSSGYDIKWLFRTIANTQAYQREVRAQPTDGTATPFASVLPARLRSDQIYNSLFRVLGVRQGGVSGFRSREIVFRSYGLDPQRLAFSALFGFDPSTPQDDILGNVPQALFLMNAPQIASQMRGTGNTPLARILREQSDNVDALDELYLLVLSRSPTEEEKAIGLEHIRDAGSRVEAFEDLQWSLLNSTEFLTKR